MNQSTVRACLLAAALAPAAFPSAGASDEPWTINHAPDSNLPQGPGIASHHSSSSPHPAVIFHDDFDTGTLENRWDDRRNVDTVLRLVEGGADGGRCLEVIATLGENTGGGLTQWFESAPTVFIRFYVRFDPDCDYIHHFVTLRANAGLSGRERWSGFGGAGIQPDGVTRFSTALEPWGNWSRWTPPGRWNFYSYWPDMKASPDGKFWGNGFRPDEQSDIPRGQWICAEFMLRHNTPGKPDGEQAFWIDGRLRGHWKGIRWRHSPDLLANALTLESYVTDRWTRQKTNVVRFDAVVIAREYIGPLPQGGLLRTEGM